MEPKKGLTVKTPKTLAEKQAAMRDHSMSFIEKKLMRKAIESMSGISNKLHCLPHHLKISMRVKANNDLQLLVVNTENELYADVTEDAAALQENFPIFLEMIERLQKVIGSLAIFWKTDADNVQFLAWMDGMGGKLICQIQPITGLHSREIIKLTK